MIVLSKYFGMGSILLMIPLLQSIRKRCPSARVVFLSFSTNAALVRLLPEVDDLLPIRTQLLPLIWDTVAAILRLWRMGARCFLDLEFFSRYSALVSFCSGAAIRSGFHTLSLSSRGRLLTHRVHWNPYRHATDNFLAVGEAVGFLRTDARIQLRWPPDPSTGHEDGVGRWKFPGPYAVFHPTARTLPHLKAYPPDRWRRLAELLQQRAGLQIVYVGDAGPDDRRFFPEGGASFCHNLFAKTTFTELVAIVEQAACLVSVDSGVAHLAALFQVPTLTLFGPDAPVLYMPRNPNGEILYQGLHCSPCVNLLTGKDSDCRDNVCIRGWDPDEVCRRVLRLLERCQTPSRNA
ncbi:MAG: glycosyltransferase family 9 protein [Candidatus Omnitrophica bacterium]|nr:glycosyltransferase family 9 protein [Candidatus Omnitrophota bacterium]